ncbi:DUF3313 family protein [Thalassotalea euphylliae]|uniref:DUF3313 family protein n=1 Tax=Thalassotalea euphylliae TaxID=1655234 RepID=UPI00363CFC5B
MIRFPLHFSYVSLAAIVSVMAVILMSSSSIAADKQVAQSFDGLELRIDEKNKKAYIDPDADFGNYSKYMLMDVEVRFRKNWQRDKNRNASTLSSRVSDEDVMNIKAEMAELFNQIFQEEFTKSNYELVDKVSSGVLLIRPAIVDLDVYNPDLDTPGRNKAYSKSTGSATIYIELYDGVSGDILARVAESKKLGDRHYYRWANRVTNRADASRVMRNWASRLIEAFDRAREK